MRKRNSGVSCQDCPYFCGEWCVRYPEHKAIEHPSLYFCGEHPAFLFAVVDGAYDDEERP